MSQKRRSPLRRVTTDGLSADAVDRACRLHDRAKAYCSQGKPAQAVIATRCALRLLESAEGPYHPDIANVLNTLAGAYEEQSNYAEVERLYQRSVAVMEHAVGGADVAQMQVQAVRHLARICRVQGRYQEAEPLYRRALALAETALGPEHLEVASCLNDLAVLDKYTGQFAEAGRLYRRALIIIEKALGPDDPAVATIYHNLGGLEHARGGCGANRRMEIKEHLLDLLLKPPARPPILVKVACEKNPESRR